MINIGYKINIYKTKGKEKALKNILFLIAVLAFALCTTTIKAQTPVNLYGYTEDGTFYIHSSLVSAAGLSGTPELVTRVTNGQSLSMTLGDNGYWIYSSGKKVLSTEKYCFKIGDEYIPYVFISKWDHPAKKNKSLIDMTDVIDNGREGFDFETGPRPMN